MISTVALVATLALAAPAEGPRDAAGWRERAEALYAQGDYRGALEAAQHARELDRSNPWVRLTWVRVLATVDRDNARDVMPGLQDPAAIGALAQDERARLHTALGYLCLDLNLEPLAAMHFSEVAAATTSYGRAQAGLAILAVRRGHTRQALLHFDAARSAGQLDAPLAELERETRFQATLVSFTTARDLRDANVAGRAYADLDELRPSHPATIRARADLADLRGDQPARERALRDLLAVDRAAPGAASQLVDTLLVLKRPYDALVVARDLAPERLAGDRHLQAIERSWVSHLDATLGGRWHEGETGHDRLQLPEARLAWTANYGQQSRIRIGVDFSSPESDIVPAGEPFGRSPALALPAGSQSDSGVAAFAHWAPRTGLLVEFGHTATDYEISNFLGALRFRVASPDGPLDFGVERLAIGDSLLSLAGATDPLTGRDWGGVVRNRAYVNGSFGDDVLNLYGNVAGALVDGESVDDNASWEAALGFWRRTATGSGWRARLGGNVRALGYGDNRSHFTIGHGGYFSPRRFLSVGPTFDLSGRRDSASFRVEGGVSWQVLRTESSAFFPTDPALQAASGNPRYAGDSREGVGARLAATVEWRVSNRSVAGLRLEGMRGEDFDEVRLQMYTRIWNSRITDTASDPPGSAVGAESYELN